MKSQVLSLVTHGLVDAPLYLKSWWDVVVHVKRLTILFIWLPSCVSAL